MFFNVRCFKCGQHEVRVVLGGRSIIHAHCEGCDSNLLAEVMEFEQQIADEQQSESREIEPDETAPGHPPDSLDGSLNDGLDEDTAAAGE